MSSIPLALSSARLSVAALTFAVLGGMGSVAFAQDHGRGPGGHGGPGPGGPRGPAMSYDTRYHHDHFYPPRGYVVPTLPRGSVRIAYGGHPWYFQGGVWFRPSGPRFVVAVPPIGIVLPVLPSAYVSLSIGGLPYYYANGAYYSAVPGGYAVVTPPPGADAAQPVPMAPAVPPVPMVPATPAVPPVPPAPVPRDPVIYPRNDQSPAQMEADHRACNRWATTQPSAVADTSVFQRAVEACMDARGYTLR